MHMPLAYMQPMMMPTNMTPQQQQAMWQQQVHNMQSMVGGAPSRIQEARVVVVLRLTL
jgi:hypothetical protein